MMNTDDLNETEARLHRMAQRLPQFPPRMGAAESAHLAASMQAVYKRYRWRRRFRSGLQCAAVVVLCAVTGAWWAAEPQASPMAKGTAGQEGGGTLPRPQEPVLHVRDLPRLHELPIARKAPAYYGKAGVQYLIDPLHGFCIKPNGTVL